MYEAIMQKQVMNGSVVPLIDKPKHDEIVDKAKNLSKMFY